MSLPSSGTIKLSEIKAEFGKGNNLLDYLGEGGVTGSAPLKLTDFYGTQSGPTVIIDQNSGMICSIGCNNSGRPAEMSLSNRDSSWYVSLQNCEYQGTGYHRKGSSARIEVGKTYICRYKGEITVRGTYGGGISINFFSSPDEANVTGFGTDTTGCSSGNHKYYGSVSVMEKYPYSSGEMRARDVDGYKKRRDGITSKWEYEGEFSFTPTKSSASWPDSVQFGIQGWSQTSGGSGCNSCTLRFVTCTIEETEDPARIAAAEVVRLEAEEQMRLEEEQFEIDAIATQNAPAGWSAPSE